MTTIAPAIAVDTSLAHTVIGEVAYRLLLRRYVYVVEVIPDSWHWVDRRNSSYGE